MGGKVEKEEEEEEEEELPFTKERRRKREKHNGDFVTAERGDRKSFPRKRESPDRF